MCATRLNRRNPRIIRAMGRMRIKKKDAVLPFRETVAYRFIMVGTALISFLITSVLAIRSIGQNTVTVVVFGLIAAAMAGFAIYNLKQMSGAKVPRRTIQRMKRHR